MITIGVFAKQKILKEALCSMLESNDEFSAVAVTSDISGLAEEIKESQFNILLFNMYSPNFEEMRFLSQINSSCPRTRILVMSQSNDEELILKTRSQGIPRCQCRPHRAVRGDIHAAWRLRLLQRVHNAHAARQVP